MLRRVTPDEESAPMASRSTAFTAAALLAATLATPALAGTSTSSLVSDSISTSIGTSSDSISDSSRVSSGPPRVAAGDYQVIQVAELAAKPGRVALRLQGAGEAFTLEVPAQTLANNPVAVGDTITASERPYGVELAVAKTRRVFFLVLDDATHREIETRPVVL
jgi:hypothetical protein